MEYDREFEASISHALREVEKDLSLPGNSLVDETPLPKSMVVLLDQNFMARIPDNLIKHSRELKLRKRFAEQDETISLLGKALNVLLEP